MAKYEEFNQKRASSIRSEHIIDRDIDELIGITKGILADGFVNKDEALFVKNWIEKHFSKEYLNTYPLKQIYSRLIEVFKDNKYTKDEAEDLKKLFMMFSGEEPITDQVKAMSSTLPLCNPAPDVEFKDKVFCFTGAFTIGTRTQCEEIVRSLGGSCSKSITKKVDYLVIGIIGSDAWIHSSYGRKIEKAVKYREELQKPNIISEEHFIKYV